MRHMISVFFCMLAIAALTSGQSEVKCDILGFVSDPDSGVNVRSGPGREFGIVKTVPNDAGRTTFVITASRGDWLRVKEALTSDAPVRTVFAGDGWVHAPVLAVTELRRFYKVFESPTKQSKQIRVSLYDHVLPLAGCSGRWVKVALPVTGTGTDKKKNGWIPDGLWCGNPAYDCES